LFFSALPQRTGTNVPAIVAVRSAAVNSSIEIASSLR